jgi:hypothetical protein
VQIQNGIRSQGQLARASERVRVRKDNVRKSGDGVDRS